MVIFSVAYVSVSIFESLQLESSFWRAGNIFQLSGSCTHVRLQRSSGQGEGRMRKSVAVYPARGWTAFD